METKGGFYISQIKQLQGRIFEKMLADKGLAIHGGQGKILFILWKKDHLTVSELSEQTSLAKNTVSIVIDGMVTKGLVERKINPDNRRQTIISLTPHARSMEVLYEEVSQQMNSLFYTGFETEEKDYFEGCLERIISTLLQYEAESKTDRSRDEA